jgi:hypothetical protein
MNVRLHIERLVMEGVELTPAEARAFQTSFEQELGRLVSESGMHPSMLAGGAVPRLLGPDVRMQSGRGGAQLGETVAQSVHGGLRK